MALTKEDLQAFETLMDEKLDTLTETKLAPLMDEKLDTLTETKFALMMDRKLQPIHIRLERIESDVSSLKSGQIDLRQDVREIRKKVDDTYELALDAWGMSTENRKWLEGKKATS